MSIDAPLRRPALSRRLQRGAYLLPSLFTILNVLLGFYAVICGLQGDFPRAALLIFVAAVTDSLDGRIARMTGTETEFGKEFDSLADVITFGVAPALLAYLWGVRDLAPHASAWLVPLFYVVTAASRLARFNVQQLKADSRFFVGLPVPAAAVAICSLLFFAPDPAWRDWILGAMVISLLVIGALMVSTFRYYSFKKLDLRRRWSYRVALPLAAIVVVVVYALTSGQLLWQAIFMLVALVYTLSGPATYLWHRLLRRRHGRPPGAPPLLAVTGPQPGRRTLVATTVPAVPPAPAPGTPPAAPPSTPGGSGTAGSPGGPGAQATKAPAATPLPAAATPPPPLPLPLPEKESPPDKKKPADKDKKSPPDRKSPP
jgi:CDP-diacylglycerol---serine O-phosphatidyltransferase